jgi:hypothetical protein
MGHEIGAGPRTFYMTMCGHHLPQGKFVSENSGSVGFKTAKENRCRFEYDQQSSRTVRAASAIKCGN